MCISKASVLPFSAGLNRRGDKVDKRGFLQVLTGAALSPFVATAQDGVSAVGVRDESKHPSSSVPFDQEELRKKVELLNKLQKEHFAQLSKQVVKVPGREAFDHWKKLRTEKGSYPIIIGNNENLSMLVEFSEVDPVDSILKKAADYVYPADFLKRQEKETAEFFERMPNFPKHLLIDEQNPPRGPWPDVPNEHPKLSVIREIFEGDVRISETVNIWRSPSEDWTEAFAHARFGGWNANPFPHEHVSAFRHWRDRYGLELVGMSNDQLNLIANKPPKTKDEAIALAIEQYRFCADIVDQGVGTIESLAHDLMTHNWWYFWWD